MDKWKVAQGKELDWQVWYYTDHIPVSGRTRVEGYRVCEGRYMALHCGIPHGGLGFEDIKGKLLDDGCGAVSVWEHREDLEVTAIDPLMQEMAHHPRLKVYAKLGIKNNALYLGQPLETIGLGGEFDWVWCYNVLDHTEDWKKHLAHCKRVLKPGGVLLLGTDVREDNYDWSEHDDERALHPCQFTAADVVRELSTLGIKIEWQRNAPSGYKKMRFGLRGRK